MRHRMDSVVFKHVSRRDTAKGMIGCLGLGRASAWCLETDTKREREISQGNGSVLTR